MNIFKPGDKVTSDFVFSGTGTILTEGYDDLYGTWHMIRTTTGTLHVDRAAVMTRVPSVTFTEAQIKTVEYTLRKVCPAPAAKQARNEIVYILRQTYTENQEKP